MQTHPAPSFFQETWDKPVAAAFLFMWSGEQGRSWGRSLSTRCWSSQQGPCSCRRLVQHRQWGQAGGTRGRPSRPQLCWQCSSQPCREAQPCHPSDRVLLPHSTSLRTPWAPQLGPAAKVWAPCSPAGAAPGQSGIPLRGPRLQSAS